MTYQQLQALEAARHSRRRWLLEHRQAADRRLSRARINYARAKEHGASMEIAASQIELNRALACVGEWGPVA